MDTSYGFENMFPASLDTFMLFAKRRVPTCSIAQTCIDNITFVTVMSTPSANTHKDAIHAIVGIMERKDISSSSFVI